MLTATRARTTKLTFSTPLAREAHFRASTIVANAKKTLLWRGWQRHCVVKSRVRENCQIRTWFAIRNCKRVFDELQIYAGGEKPGRQQHIHDEHVQKSHSHTRGVVKLKNATRTEGATHKKK